MRNLVFIPIGLFLAIYLGVGIYFSAQGVDQAFYQISPTVCILPSLFLGIFMGRRSLQENLESLINGMRHRDIMTMCIIFLLAGAFSKVTYAIGSVDAMVHMALYLIPNHFLLIGIFLIASFISTAIGTSMGVIALVTPIAIGLAQKGAFPMPIGIATVVSGAMFGDNLSMISDTTIAAVMSQEADQKKKFKLNAKIALLAGVLTIGCLAYCPTSAIEIQEQSFQTLKILPYFIILAAGFTGMNVFMVLVIGLISAGAVCLFQEYTFTQYAQDIYQGFLSMHEIMVLSLFVGGLGGMLRDQGASQILFQKLARIIKTGNTARRAELMLAGIASFFDILVANNTIAIILSGDIARDIARKFQVSAHRSAYILDTFSCVFQGIIPYGAQILLASSLAGLSPLELSAHVYYCYILAAIALLDIAFRQKKTIDQ